MGRQWAKLALTCFAAVLLMGSEPGRRTLEISIREVDDSKPIPRAELVIEREENSPIGFASLPEDLDGRVITRAESNERGEIRLQELPPVSMRLSLKAEGYAAPAIATLDGRTSHKLNLRLPRTISVTGSVSDDTGVPLSGVDVAIQSRFIDREGRVFLAASTFMGRTSADGTFRIESVPEGMGRITVAASGYALSDDGAFRDLSRSPIALRVQRTGLLRVDIDAPLHRRGQYWITIESKDANGRTAAKREKAGADRGWITFSDLPVGKYSVSASIRSKKPDPPLTTVAEVRVARATEVRLIEKRD